MGNVAIGRTRFTCYFVVMPGHDLVAGIVVDPGDPDQGLGPEGGGQGQEIEGHGDLDQGLGQKGSYSAQRKHDLY